MAQYCILYILSMSSFKTVYQMLDLCCLCLLITVFYCQLLETAAAGDDLRQISSDSIQNCLEVRVFKLEENWLRENRCEPFTYYSFIISI